MEVQTTLSGVCFSPYTDGQSPDYGAIISESQSHDRLAILFSKFPVQSIRIYGSTNGLEKIPIITRNHFKNVNVSAGAWISKDRSSNEKQLQSLIKLCNCRDENGKPYVNVAVVGNEVLLRGDLPEDELIELIQKVRAAIPKEVMVTTAEPYGLLHKHHTKLFPVCDIIYVHIYSYWDKVPLEHAISHIATQYDRIRAIVLPSSKKVVIAEVGYPSGGEAFGAALPSPSHAATFFKRFVLWAAQNHVDYFYFQAFDEKWKASHEGERGAHWGILDSQGNLKEGFTTITSTQPSSSSASREIRLELTDIPPIGVNSPLRGKVTMLYQHDNKTMTSYDMHQYRVVTSIRVGGGWWTKPTFSQPFTLIHPDDGSFSVGIVTGGNDLQATDIAVFVIPQDYSPPLSKGEGSLPQELYERAVASSVMKRPHPK